MHVARWARFTGLTGLLATGVVGTMACGGGSKTQAPAPAISSFTAARNPITAGEGVQLLATFSQGEGSIDQGVGAVQSGIPVTVTAHLDTTYRLTVTNGSGGTDTSNLTLKVVPAPVAQIKVSQRVVAEGAVDLVASVTEQPGCTYQWKVSQGNLLSSPTSRVVTVQAGAAGTMSLSCTVTNAAGKSHTDTTDVTVLGLPSITSFTASANPTPVGLPVTLTALFNGGNGFLSTGQPLASGQGVLVTPQADTVYTLTVSGPSGHTATASLLVRTTAKEGLAIQSFTATPAKVASGAAVQLNARFTGGLGTVEGVGSITSGEPLTVHPTQTTTYILVVKNSYGESVRASAKVEVERWNQNNGGAGFQRGAYDLTANQPAAFNWSRFSNFTGPQRANIRWTVPVNTSNGSPVIAADGTIYLASQTGLLHAFRPDDGTEKWRTATTTNSSVGSCAIGADGTVYTLGASLEATSPSGVRLWSLPTGAGNFATPSFAGDGTIYVSDMNGYVTAAHPDGTQAWKSAKLGSGIAASIAVCGDGTLVVPTFHGPIVALTPQGTVKWTNASLVGFVASALPTDRGTVWVNAFAGAPPAVAARVRTGEAVVGTGPVLAELDGQTGAVIRSIPLGVRGVNDCYSQPVLGPDGMILVGTDSALVAVKDGAILWSLPLQTPAATPIVGKDGTIYVPAFFARTLYAIRPDGSILWSQVLNTNSWSSPALAKDGTLYVTSQMGLLYAFGL